MTLYNLLKEKFLTFANTEEVVLPTRLPGALLHSANYADDKIYEVTNMSVILQAVLRTYEVEQYDWVAGQVMQPDHDRHVFGAITTINDFGEAMTHFDLIKTYISQIFDRHTGYYLTCQCDDNDNDFVAVFNIDNLPIFSVRLAPYTTALDEPTNFFYIAVKIYENKEFEMNSESLTVEAVNTVDVYYDEIIDYAQEAIDLATDSNPLNRLNRLAKVLQAIQQYTTEAHNIDAKTLF